MTAPRPRRRATRRAAALAALLALAALALPAAAGAGVRIETVTRRVDAEEGPSAERATMRIDGERLRIDAGDGRGSLLYDGGAGKAWLLDHGDRSYVSVDRSQARALAEQARALQAEMRRRLEGRLTPEQLEAAEQFLGGPAEEAGQTVRVRETGGRDEIAGVPCRELELLREDERVAALCGAEPDAAGLPPAAFALLRDVAGFVEESVGGLAPGGVRQAGLDLLRGTRDLDVLPLRVRAFEDGELVTESEVERIEREPVPAETFALPEGYRAMFAVQVRGEGASAPASGGSN